MRSAMAQGVPPPQQGQPPPQGNTPTPDDVQNFMGDLPTPDSGPFFSLNIHSDQAVDAMRYIFGNVIDVVAGDPTAGGSIGAGDTAFANMIGMMNAGLIFLAAIYLAWVTIVGTLYTADKGEIFGQKWSVVWMPIKTTLGVSAIFPVVYGYSWLQIFIFWVLLNGIGLGNSVMSMGFEMFAKNKEFSHIDPISPHIVTLSNDILRSAYCAEAINLLRDDTLQYLRNSVTDGDISDEVGQRAAMATGALPNMGMYRQEGGNRDNLASTRGAGEIYKTVSYYWGAVQTSSTDLINAGATPRSRRAARNRYDDDAMNDMTRKDYCGHATFRRVVDYRVPYVETADVSTRRQGGRRIRELDPHDGALVRKRLQAVIEDREAAKRMLGFGNAAENIGERELAVIHTWVDGLNTIGRNLARRNSPFQRSVGAVEPRPAEAMSKTEILAFERKIDDINRAYADARESIFQEFETRGDPGVAETLESFYWENFRDNLERDGFLSFGSYYVELSEARSLAKRRMSTQGTYVPSEPDIWHTFQLNQTTDAKIKIDSMSGAMQTDLWGYFRAYYNFNRVRELNSGIIDVEGLPPGVEGFDRERNDKVSERDRLMEQVYTGDDAEPGYLGKKLDAALGELTDFLHANIIEKYQYIGGPPPLLRIREMGQDFMSMVGPTVGLGGFASLVGNLKNIPVGGMGVLATASEALGGFLFTVGLWLFLLGGFMGAYLPMVPFFIWVGAVIGYFLLAIESIIAAPLWAIAFMEPATQDGPGGKNAQGWYLVMNLFLRPVLLVVSMIAVMLLADVILNYLNIYLLPTFQMSTNMEGGVTGFLMFIWASIIYCVFLLITMHGVYSLIHRIPDNIMEWLGVGVRGLGDLSDEGHVRSMVMAAIYRAQPPSGKALGNIVGPSRGGGKNKPQDPTKISTEN